MTMPLGWDDKIRKDSDPNEIKESIIWSDQVTSGFFRPRVADMRYISNLKVSTYHGSISLVDVDDIVVTNTKRMSQSQYSGYSAGRYTRFGTGNVKSNSRTVGDVMFIAGGRPVVTIDQVQDPQGVARIAKAARKELIARTKLIEKAAIQQKRIVVEKTSETDTKTINLSDFTSRDQMSGSSPLHIIPDKNWRLTHSMVSPRLIKSPEYQIQITEWFDGKENCYYNKAIIHPIETGNFIEILNDQDTQSSVKMDLVNIKPELVWDTGFMNNKPVKDVKLKVTRYVRDYSSLINPSEKEETVTMNVLDGGKDNIHYMINNLTNIERNTLYWLRVDGVGQARHKVYPLIPFYGTDELVVWYNILVRERDGRFEITNFQTLTNIRFLTYDYEKHEGKTLTFDQFDSVDIRTGPQLTEKLYSSNIGAYTEPINPLDFKKLRSPKDVILLRQGDPVFTFHEVQEPEMLLEIIQRFQNQLEVKNQYARTMKTSESGSSLKESITPIRCAHCGKNVESDSKFCNYCGARMTPTCSRCNHENPVGSEFCSSCGFVLN